MQRFGRFEIRELLGEGGFGRVFRAYDPSLKREVAIKTCRLGDPAVRRRFLREAEIAAGLRHPCIVVVHELGDEGGEPFMVQEFLPGEDLETLIVRKAPIDVQRKVRWLRDTADALAFAHEHGVIHRDVKPHNIRILPDGGIRVLDFGIAKRTVDRATTALTQTGFSIGTLGYMSPEQLMGTGVDHRADIFSFGAVAFRLLTYVDPFDGDTPATVFYRIANVNPEWPALVTRACGPQLIACIDRCLEKRAEDRPEAREVVAILDSLPASRVEVPAYDSATLAVDASPLLPRARRLVPGAVAGTLLVTAVGMVLRWSGGRSQQVDPIDVPRVSIADPDTGDSHTSDGEILHVVKPDTTGGDQKSDAPGAGPISRPGSVQPGTALAAVVVEAGPAGSRLDASLEGVTKQMVSEQLAAAGLRVVATEANAAAEASVLASARRRGQPIAVICRITVTDVVDANEFGMASATVSVSLVALSVTAPHDPARASSVATGAGTSVGAAADAAVRRAMAAINGKFVRDLSSLHERIR